jgi:hypothetical protein
VDWLAFDRRRRTHWAAPFAWPVFPLAYGVFVLVTAPLLPRTPARRYVYPFLDVERLGWPGLALVALAALGGFVLVGYTLIGLHRIGVRAVPPATAQ